MADLYGAITDDAANRIIGFIHARAPYLFNYVAPSVRLDYDQNGQFTGFTDNWLVCSPVAPDPPPGVPRYTRIPPFGLPGVAVKLPCSVQVIDVDVDFHPSDTLTLPNELSPPLATQHFAIRAMIQFGVACVPAAAVQSPNIFALNPDVPLSRLPVLPVESLTCFLVQIFATGHLTVTPPSASSTAAQIGLAVDGLEIVDIAPAGLEQAVECYLIAMLKGDILPRLVLALQTIPVGALGITSVTPSLTTGLPNNPAIEQNELRVWLDLAFL
jgi:hypothetical protein